MFNVLMQPQSRLWDEFQNLQRELDSLFYPGSGRADIRAVAAGSFPTLNVGSTPDAVHVYLFAPGLDSETLDVSIQRNVLTVSGRREADENNGYHLRERFAGAFRRAVSLPDDVDPDRVEASYRDGVLAITVAKREASKPRQIDIQRS